MDTQRFRALSPRHRALVAIAVLIDGHEGALYLENDAQHGHALKRAADELASLEVELRMPYVGSLLRNSLLEI